MKKEKKILIVSVMNHLDAIRPGWDLNGTRSQRLKTLYQSWSAGEVRRGRHSNVYFSNAWKRGWLKDEDFSRFYEYALQ
jgi:hypothetical protein